MRGRDRFRAINPSVGEIYGNFLNELSLKSVGALDGTSVDACIVSIHPSTSMELSSGVVPMAPYFSDQLGQSQWEHNVSELGILLVAMHERGDWPELIRRPLPSNASIAIVLENYLAEKSS